MRGLPAIASVALGLALASATRSARAGASPSGGAVAGWIVLALAPHDAGPLFTRVEPTEPYLSLGWTMQFPVSESRRQRIVGGLDWNPAWDGHRVRARFGYRFGFRYPFFGFAALADKTGLEFAPELGVRLVTSSKSPLDRADFAIHFIVRADVPARVNELRAISVLAGWSLF